MPDLSTLPIYFMFGLKDILLIKSSWPFKDRTNSGSSFAFCYLTNAINLNLILLIIILYS